MTPANNVTTRSSLVKRALQGAGIALALILFFLFTAGAPKPEWGQLWMIRPLIIVPLAGAAGGVFYYFMDHLPYPGLWKKAVGIVGYLFGLWLGIVLGLDGTWWD